MMGCGKRYDKAKAKQELGGHSEEDNRKLTLLYLYGRDIIQDRDIIIL